MVANVSFAGVHLDPRATAEVLRGPGGPVLRHALIKGQAIKAGARARIKSKTGTLANSLVARIVPAAGGADVVVGSNVSYAIFHHEGTRPHVILPRKASVLAFDVGGQRVFARRVNHPGTKPNRFLVDAARAEGLIVRITRGVL